MEENLAIGFAPDEADRQTATQFPARSLVANTTVQAIANDVQLCFAHRTL